MIESTEIEHTPTFLLRGITHEEVWATYSQGDFSDMKKIHNKTFEMVGSHIDNPLADPNTTYNIKTRSNHVMKVLMPGGVRVKNSDGESLKPGGLCGWTREKIPGLPVILPVKCYYDPITKITTYVGVNEFKNFERAFAYYRKFCGSSTNTKGMYSDSYVLLRNLFRSLYPDDTLKCSKDFSLHVNFNGPLDCNNFDDDSHEYYKTTGVRVIPGQLQYIEGTV